MLSQSGCIDKEGKLVKKRRFLAVLSLCFLALVMILSSCQGAFTPDEAMKYAIEKYGMDEILCCVHIDDLFGLTVNGEYMSEKTYDYDKEYSGAYTYILGEKNGEEAALIFPLFNGERRVCESKWLFDVSFKDMAAMLNAKAGKIICPVGTEYFFSVLSTLYDKDEMLRLVPQIEQLTLDVPLMFIYSYSNDNYYAIVQSDGNILIFDVVEQNEN